MPQGHALLGVIHFWGPFWDALFSGCMKREMLHGLVNKMEMSFVDSKWDFWRNRFSLHGLYLFLHAICPRTSHFRQNEEARAEIPSYNRRVRELLDIIEKNVKLLSGARRSKRVTHELGLRR